MPHWDISFRWKFCLPAMFSLVSRPQPRELFLLSLYDKKWNRWRGGGNLFLQHISQTLKGYRDVFCGLRVPAHACTACCPNSPDGLLPCVTVLSYFLCVHPDTQPETDDSCLPSPHPGHQRHKGELDIHPEEFAEDLVNVSSTAWSSWYKDPLRFFGSSGRPHKYFIRYILFTSLESAL